MRAFAASLAEMWSSSRRQTRLSPDEVTAERLLAGQSLGGGVPASQRTLELVLTSAAGPATERELAGEAAAVTAFLAARTEQGKAPRRRSPRRIPAVAVAVVLVVLVAFGGTAEAGALPGPLQRLAHRAIDAPAPAPRPAVRNPARNGNVTRGPGGTGTQPAPAGHGLSQPSHTASPIATPAPAHTDNGKGNDNGNGKGNGKGTGNGNGNDKSNGKSNGNGQGNGKGKGNG